MFTDKKNLIRLIEEAVEKALLEQEEPAETPPPEAAAAEAEPGAATADVPADLDLSAGGEADIGAPGGADADVGLGDLEPDTEGEDGDIGSAAGGGFAGGFSGGGGGGFSFGDDGAAGIDADQPEEEATVSTIGPEDVEIPADPVMAIVDDAIQMLNQTRNPQTILKNTKSSIQRYFPEFEDASPVIKSLWDTEDVVLRDVARRLLLFIKGE
jgi:hypothetical protein